MGMTSLNRSKWWFWLFVCVCYDNIRDTYLKYVISNVVNLNCRCISIAELWTQHALEARWCCDKYNFMAIKYFTLDSVAHNVVQKEEEKERKIAKHVCIWVLDFIIVCSWCVCVCVCVCGRWSVIYFHQIIIDCMIWSDHMGTDTQCKSKSSLFWCLPEHNVT